MRIEQVKPNKPSFGMVVALAAGALIVIIIAAVVILEWHSHSKPKAPFARHPISQIHVPAARDLAA